LANTIILPLEGVPHMRIQAPAACIFTVACTSSGQRVQRDELTKHLHSVGIFEPGGSVIM